MWVLTEYGRLINLDRFYAVNVHEVTGHQVIARSENEDISSVVLCSCDNEEHGAEIVRHIAYALEDGVELYDIRNAKVFAYTCEVCGQRFDVPRRGGKVHFLRGKVVCPDCWTAGQDESRKKEGVQDGSST